MSDFNELIKNFETIREYMRDFYIYGFKVRCDYTYKSPRTYDNERRRIESWLSGYVHWESSAKGKRVFLSVDSAQVAQNPLYAVWKSKSFTRGDLLLHFTLLSLLGEECAQGRTTDELADAISSRYGLVFDSQTVRGKLREYEELGLLCSHRMGRALYYQLERDMTAVSPSWEKFLDGVRFFQEVAPFGFLGSTLMERAHTQNYLFRFKHHYIVHTLEDGILLPLLEAMQEGRVVELENMSRKSGAVHLLEGVPLRILVSAQTGRRYLCLYRTDLRRFLSLRLDSISKVTVGEPSPLFPALRRSLQQNLPLCWGVSFGDRQRRESLFLKLQVDERREGYILERLRREGRAGEVLRVEENIFLYSVSCFDSNEILPWVKTFTGRILALEGTNRLVVEKFHRDVDRMYRMYCGEDSLNRLECEEEDDEQ